MPSFHIFGRRWSISSDDFVFPEITEAWIRFVWLSISCFIYITRAQTNICVHLQAFMIVSLVTNFVVICICLTTAYVSSLGTILNGLPRRNLKIILYLRCPLIGFEIAWNIVGCVWLSQSNLQQCDRPFLIGVAITVAGGWLMVLILIVGIILNFDPTGTVHHGDVKMTDETRKLWQNRLKLAFLCASNNDRAKMAFEDVAELFVDLFADSDLVWTDVWAAVILLSTKEISVLNQRSFLPASRDAAPYWMNVHTASRVMDFALGVYGWPYYLYGRGCGPRPLYELMRRGRCCGSCRCDSAVVIKDNCCLFNTAALLMQTDIEETDLFYVNLHNEIWETPFVACFDHSTKSIVISIRGSLSMRDAITDLTAIEDTLELNSCNITASGSEKAPVENQLSFTNPNRANSIPNDQSVKLGNDSAEQDSSQCIKCHAHRGMLLSARYVLSRLESEHILDDMFVLQPSYSLILTGHSLGAGVAALLGIMLKPRYPALKCYAFSPPGCVISEEGAEFTQSFVYSIVCGDDLVARSSIESMRALKENVMEALQHCDRSKYEILLKGCYKLICGRRRRPTRPDSGASTAHSGLEPQSSSASDGGLSPPPGRIVTPVQVPTVAGANGDLLEQGDDSPLIMPGRRMNWSYTEEMNLPTSTRVQLYCPGRIMHIQPRRKSSGKAAVTYNGGVDTVAFEPQQQQQQNPTNVGEQAPTSSRQISSMTEVTTIPDDSLLDQIICLTEPTVSSDPTVAPEHTVESSQILNVPVQSLANNRNVIQQSLTTTVGTTAQNSRASSIEVTVPEVGHTVAYSKPMKKKIAGRWVHRSHFSEVCLTSSMISDHMPWTVSSVLREYDVQKGGK